MPHDHHHPGHSHELTVPADAGAAFIWGVILNSLFVIVEVIVGFSTNSLSLLSDAGHNLADVGSLALSLLAFRMMKAKANDQYTFGYRKSSVLAALLNAVILLVSLGAIVYEAVQRLFHQQALPGLSITAVAILGIFINGISAWLFNRNRKDDINIKSAYLHLLADAAISAGVAVAGVIMYYTNWFWLDAVVSIAIAVIILITTWQLLSESLRLSMDGVPSGIDLKKVREAALAIPGVKDFHHVHVWALSSTENALTAHLIVAELSTAGEVLEIKNKLKHALYHQDITHVTIETETPGTKSEQEKCDI